MAPRLRGASTYQQGLRLRVTCYVPGAGTRGQGSTCKATGVSFSTLALKSSLLDNRQRFLRTHEVQGPEAAAYRAGRRGTGGGSGCANFTLRTHTQPHARTHTPHKYIYISATAIRVRPPGVFYTYISITTPVVSALKNYYNISRDF